MFNEPVVAALNLARRLVRKVGDGTAPHALFVVRRIYFRRWNYRGSVLPLPSVRQAFVECRVTDGERQPPPTGVGGGCLAWLFDYGQVLGGRLAILSGLKFIGDLLPFVERIQSGALDG